MRLEKNSRTRAVLMISDNAQKPREFVAIANILRDMDISAPEIYAANLDDGLILMEDFGDENFGKMLDSGADVSSIYRRGISVLSRLHSKFDRSVLPGAGLPVFNAELFASQVELFLDGYVPYAQNREATADEREEFHSIWFKALKPMEELPQTLLLRDYMPDNLMSLPSRKGWRDAGVLDFQDGGQGPLPYDIASLCEVVRRDSAADLLSDMIDEYLKQNPVMKKADLLRACTVLSAQRHARILGNVAGRSDKRVYLPRIWKHMISMLQDDSLRHVKNWFEERKLFP